MFMVNCPGCTRSFPYEPNKKFHDETCRKRFNATRKREKDHELWMRTAEYPYPESLRDIDPEEKGRKILIVHEKTGARFYRLGCPRNAGTPPHELRWFPTLGGGAAFLSINPFESPSSLPLPGLYLVALFSETKELLWEPAWKICVLGFNPKIRWSSGSLKP